MKRNQLTVIVIALILLISCKIKQTQMKGSVVDLVDDQDYNYKIATKVVQDMASNEFLDELKREFPEFSKEKLSSITMKPSLNSLANGKEFIGINIHLPVETFGDSQDNLKVLRYIQDRTDKRIEFYRDSLIYSVRSGNIQDEDIAEPLCEKCTGYKDYLITSNGLIEKIKDRKYKELYDQYFSDELKGSANEEKISESISKFGVLENYKDQQWNFAIHYQKGRKLINSTKIAHHQKGLIKYTFVFDFGVPDKILGLHSEVMKKK